MLGWLKGKRDKRPTYEEAKQIAQEGDADARRDLAALGDLEPELLYFFSTDGDATVRKAVAENPSAPIHAKAILSKDENVAVREILAKKITAITPALGQEETQKTSELVIEVLEDLASDQLPAIRAILSEEIKHIDNIPQQTVSKLARDVDAAVASPVLEFSPLLEDDELMEIIADSIHDEALTAIAKRNDLQENVANAVAETENSQAVQALLENQSANIADNTLTYISERADQHENWHGPLVERPTLPMDAVKNVAGYISTTLVNQLIEKHELPNETVLELRMAVFERLNKLKGPNFEKYRQSRALVVEENEDLRRQMEDILTELGFVDIRSTASGDKALRIFSAERTPVALMICSDSLEDVEGIEMLEEAKDLDEEIAFIMTSHEADEAAISEAKELHVNEWLLKPFKEDALTQRVHKVMR